MGPVVALGEGVVFANDYRIESPLSAGGMGAVYVVEQLSTGKRRALKVMHPQLVSNAELRKRFEREARIGSRIDSDHVVEVHAAGIDGATGTPYIIMELLRGKDLAHHLASGGLGRDQIRTIFEQLCHAVGAAHEAGVVHRDLKPENVFLAQSRLTNAGLVVKVLDFGIAKLAAEAGSSTAAMGSPLWMPPEQTERTSITPAADVWALGLIAYYMLTGKLFWRVAQLPEPGMQQLLREICLDPIPPASVRAAEVGVAERLPPDFDAWFAKCVERDPTKRFQDARACWAGLAVLLGVEPQSGPILPRSAAPPGSLGLTPSAATVVTPPPITSTPPPSPEPPKGRSKMPMLAAVGGAVLLGALAIGWRFAPHGTATAAQPSATAPEADPDAKAVADAKALCDQNHCDVAHEKLASLAPTSKARQSADALGIEARWATESLDRAEHESDATKKRALLEAIAQSDVAPAAQRAAAADKVKELDAPAPLVTLTVDAGTHPSTDAHTASAVGAAGAAPTAPIPHGPMTARPAADVVRAAVASVLPSARRCLTHETFEAEIIFGSDGAVRTVNLSDSESPRVAACVRAALSKARLPAFTEPTYSDPGVIVRPL